MPRKATPKAAVPAVKKVRKAARPAAQAVAAAQEALPMTVRSRISASFT